MTDALWDNIDGTGHFHGLNNNDNNATTYFPWNTTDGAGGLDDTKTIGQMSWTFSNFRDLNSNGSADTHFILSHDGGVPPISDTPSLVPEPTGGVLLGLSLIGLLGRRHRQS